jgi:hypothetical protein
MLQTLRAPHVCALLALALPVVLSAQDNPAVGTWKLNVAKSKYSTGALPTSATLAIQTAGDGLKTSYEEVGAGGSHNAYEYTAGFDGADSALTVTGDAAWRANMLGGAETVSLRHAGANSYSTLLKNPKGIVMTMRSVVSKNGKVMTVTAGGADANGQPVSFVTAWDKQ